MSELEAIYHFHKIDENLATAGQPTIEQFSTIKSANYTLIINLADGTTERDILDEAEIVSDLGLNYHQLPVDWENPKDSDIDAFFDLLSDNQYQKIFVHCIANYRVAAFVFLYRVLKQSVPIAEAQSSKDAVWKPKHVFPKWDAFIERTLTRYRNEEL